MAMGPPKGHGRVSKSVSHAPSEPVTAGSVNRGKDWESRHCDKPGSIKSSSPLFKPLKKTGFFDSDTGSQPRSSHGTSYPRLQLGSPLSSSQKDLGPKSAPPLATSVIQTYFHQSPASPTHELGPSLSLLVSGQTAEASYQHTQLASSPPFAPHNVEAKSAPSLALSAIRTYLQHSPVLSTGPNTSSSVSVDHDSPGTIPGEKLAPIRPRSLDQSLLPKRVSAFDYAMRPFLDAHPDDSHERLLQLPFPTHQVVSSPRHLPPPEAADTAYDGEEDEVTKDETLTEYDTLSNLWTKDAFITTMQHTQLSVYLMHCTILQDIIDQVQREPWKSSQNQPAAWYYEKMVELAYKARPLAEALKRDGLQARCEYWAGRGCGGSRDYSAAEEHFRQAILLDVPNDKYKNGSTRLRGLLPKEKADVRYLLDSCHKRTTDHKRYEKQEVEIVRIMADDYGLPFDVYADRMQAVMSLSPPWLPDRDRLVALAKAEFENPIQNADEEPQHDMGDDAQVYSQTDDEYMHAENRRRLTAKEWAYIKYGDIQEAERRERQKSAEDAFKPLRRYSTASARSNSTTSRVTSLASLPHLANELAGLGCDGDTPEASPTSVYSTSSQALTPTAMEQHPLSIFQTVPNEDTDVSRQYPSRSRTPSLESNPSLSTESSSSTDLESDALFSMDLLLDKEEFDYRPQAPPHPQLSLQQRRRGSQLDPINTIPVPPRSNRRLTSRQAGKDSPRTPPGSVDHVSSQIA